MCFLRIVKEEMKTICGGKNCVGGYLNLKHLVLTVTIPHAKFYIIIGNCVKMYADVQQVEQVARELPGVGTCHVWKWNTKAFFFFKQPYKRLRKAI